MNRKENIAEDGNITSGKNISNWTDSVSPIVFKPLTEDLETDIVIVGGGLAGISIAYCLTQEGRKVILVEDGYIGSGETGRTTAHIVTALDNRYYTLENIFGEEDTQLIAESHIAAIDFIENAVIKEKINCEFERLNGYLFLHPSDEKESLDKELEAASRAGIKVIDTDHVPGLVTDEGRCICFPEQAQFHPLKYLKGLCAIIEQKGGKIFTETHAAKIDHKGLTTKTGYTIKANHIVVATNSPVNDKYAVHLKQTAFRSYVIGALI
ncbi:MAG: FAD-dependent oxidoreductase, partial [Bacteroidota bacterium]|nr:FAD-dependent oxidoreductase [Bacteroidota bacterium]